MEILFPSLEFKGVTQLSELVMGHKFSQPSRCQGRALSGVYFHTQEAYGEPTAR